MGAFSLDIGKPVHRLGGSEAGGATSFAQVFINHPGLTINSTQCATGFMGYTPGSTDERTVSVSFSDAGREIRVVDLPIKSVPFAMQAEQISGYSVNSLFKIAGAAQSGDKPSSLFAKDGVDLLWEIAHNQDLQGRALKNLGEPTVASDAATKSYVDSLISQGSLGVITNVTGDANILAGTLGTIRALSLGTTGVTAGVYGAVGPSGGPTGVSVPVLTVDMWGRITSASQEPLPLATTGGGFGLITVDASSGLTLNSGTLGLNLSGLSGSNFGPQAQNVVLAGPLSGGTGAVSFRALDEADIPQLASTGKVQNSATSATPALTNDAIMARDAVGGFKASGAFLNYLALDNGLHAGTSSAILLSAPPAASYSLVFPGAAPQDGDLLSFNSLGQMSWVQPGAAGLTSLALSVPAAEMSVSSPIGPGDGTLSLSWRNQNAGLVFAAPTGASGQPSFRQLAASDITSGTFNTAQIPDLDAAKVTSGTFDLVRIPDLSAAKITSGTFDLARIPDLSAAKITSGTLPVSRGGTGLVPQVSDANRLYSINAAGTDSEFKTLVAGSGISISHSTGSIQISAPGPGTLGWAQGGNSFGQTGTLGTNDNQALKLRTNNATRMTITAGGSVGIGTESPSSKLSVVGAVSIDGENVTNRIALDIFNVGQGLSGLRIGRSSGAITYGSNLDTNQVDAVDVANKGLRYSQRGNGGGGAYAAHRFTGDANTSLGYASIVDARAGAGGISLFQGRQSDNSLVFDVGYDGSGYFAGNVGIGKTAPALKLDVAGSAVFRGPTSGGIDGELYYDTATHSYRYYNAGTATWESLASGAISYVGSTWDQNGSHTFYNLGRVGIGSSNPEADLDVRSSSDASFKLVKTGQVDFQLTAKSTEVSLDVSGTSQPMTFQMGGAEKMRITPAGNVGIGTTSPGSKMHLYDSNGASATPPQFIAQSTGATWMSFFASNSYGNAIYWSSNKDMRFGTSTTNIGNGFIERMRIMANGNVGIGTESPTSALHVAGKITVSGGTPVLSDCGSDSPSVVGNDTRGRITMGTGNPTTCTLTFSSAYSSEPICVVSPLSSGATPRISTISATAFTVEIPVGIDGFRFSYICLQ